MSQSMCFPKPGRAVPVLRQQPQYLMGLAITHARRRCTCQAVGLLVLTSSVRVMLVLATGLFARSGQSHSLGPGTSSRNTTLGESWSGCKSRARPYCVARRQIDVSAIVLALTGSPLRSSELRRLAVGALGQPKARLGLTVATGQPAACRGRGPQLILGNQGTPCTRTSRRRPLVHALTPPPAPHPTCSALLSL